MPDQRVLEIRFGGEKIGFLSITVRGRAYRQRQDYWDGNWLLVDATVEIEKFSARVAGMLRAEELALLSHNLDAFSQSLTDIVTYETMEGWLSFQIAADTLGKIKLSGMVSDNVRNDTSLKFAFESDQSFLAAPLKQLRQTVDAYPVIGKP